jgi:hypothetical protein
MDMQLSKTDALAGEDIFTWKSLDHVDPSESFAPLGAAGTGISAASPWDYFVRLFPRIPKLI